MSPGLDCRRPYLMRNGYVKRRGNSLEKPVNRGVVKDVRKTGTSDDSHQAMARMTISGSERRCCAFNGRISAAHVAR